MSKNSNNVSFPIEEIMGDRFGKYSKYIIQERALPDARDGLKPVQRRILYAMYKDGNTHDKGYRKSAKTVGLVIGNYHPHGDSSVYDAMVRMSQQWKMNYPLIDMHGNNGSIDDDPAAAMRYTEARLALVASNLLADIDKETVQFAPNFDDTELEPIVFPASYPNLLVNGATGIAAGYATNIPPHNLQEVIEATIYRLQFPNCTLDELLAIVKGPDFPTGGIVQGQQGIKDAFKTGRGRIVVRAKTEFIKTRTIVQLVITEIPYEVIKTNIVKKIDEIRINKDLDGLLDVRDESDRNGLKIVVDLKKEANQELILNYLLKNTDLQVYYNYNMVAIVDQRPVQMGLAQLIDAYIVHREEVILNRSRYLYNKMDKRCHILEGLMKAISIVDDIIKIIRASKDKADAKARLMKEYDFTEMQAEAIVTLRLYRLTSTDITELRNEFALLVNQMEELKTIIEHSTVLRQVIINELKEIKSFAKERSTVIQDEIEEIVIDKMSMIANEDVRIALSAAGYAKKVSLRSYQASGETVLPGLREGDKLIGSLETETLDTLLAFTSDGQYLLVPIYEIEEAKWKDVGSHLNNIVKYDATNSIISGIVVRNFETQAWIVSVTAQGMIKKTAVSEFLIQRYGRSSVSMNVAKGDYIVSTFVVYEDDDLLLLTNHGYVIRYHNEVVGATGTRSKGVIAINLSKGDEVVSACAINEQASVVVVSDKGQMKRLKNEDIKHFNRATKGELVLKRLKANPAQMRYIKAGNLNDEVIFINGEATSMMVKDISLMSKEATLSNPLTLSADWYLLEELEDVKIIDIVSNENEELTEENSDKEDSNGYEFIGLDL